MVVIGKLDNLSEWIFYVAVCPIVSILGIFSNSYVIILTHNSEKIYPTAIAIVRFILISDLGIAIFSLLWPFVYSLGKSREFEYASNMYWIIYMAYFHPTIRSSWSKTMSFLILLFTVERYITIIRRNRFTMLNNIEFVKLLALMCLALGIFISFPRIKWYKLSYYITYPGDDLSSVNRVASESKSYNLLHNAAEENLSKWVNTANTSLPFSSAKRDKVRPVITYFRRNNIKPSRYQLHAIANLASLGAYLITIYFSIHNAYFLIYRHAMINRARNQEMKKNLLVAINRQTRNLLSIKGETAVPPVTVINQTDPSLNVLSMCRKSVWSLRSQSSQTNKRANIWSRLGWPKPGAYNKTERGMGYYLLVTIPEKELALLKLQVWLSILKICCVFPGIIMTILFPYFNPRTGTVTIGTPDLRLVFENLHPFTDVLEFISVAATPYIILHFLDTRGN